MKCNSAQVKWLLFFLIPIISSLQAHSQAHRLRFKTLSANEGLSQNMIQCILKDTQGFMWFGTRDGLNRYDGYKFTTFRHNSEQASTISNNFINDIIEAPGGNLWIGTSSGLDLFDKKSEKFIHYNPDNLKLIISDLTIDKKGILWMSTVNSGLLSFDTKTRRFKAYVNDPKNQESLRADHTTKVCIISDTKIMVLTRVGPDVLDTRSGRFIKFIQDPTDLMSIYNVKIRDALKDSKGNIWLSVPRKGLARYDVATNSFSYIPATKKNGIPDNNILSIAEGPDAKLWLGTENKGLCIYDPVKNTSESYQPESFNTASLSHHTVRVVYRDPQNLMWVGTQAGGVNFTAASAMKFQHFTFQAGVNGLNHKYVTAFSEDDFGRMWIGTDGGGINTYDPKTGVFKKLAITLPTTNDGISSDYVAAITNLGDGKMAIGYNRDGGLYILNYKRNTFTYFPTDFGNGDPKKISGRSLPSILKDKKGDIWVASLGSGLTRLNLSTKTFKKYLKFPSPTSGTIGVINCIYQDREQRIWAGLQNGLYLYNPDSDSFAIYGHNAQDKYKLSSDDVTCVYEDKFGHFWVGTNAGLNLMDRKSRKFHHYGKINGIKNDWIKGLLEDSEGNLWLSTNGGISKFNQKTKAFENFDLADGLQSQEYSLRACYKSADGVMYFGGINGFNAFHPRRIQYNETPPPLVLTDFLLFNQSVVSTTESPLKSSISQAKEIVLSYEESKFISFEFAALNFIATEKNQYAYKLEGFDKDWVYGGSKRFATYTNLSPGKYVFRIKGSNNDGVWNHNGTSVTLLIRPPFWMAWWFRGLAILLLGLAIYLFFHSRTKNLKKQKQELEEQVRIRTNEIEQQAEQLQAINEELQARTETPGMPEERQKPPIRLKVYFWPQ